MGKIESPPFSDGNQHISAKIIETHKLDMDHLLFVCTKS